VHRTCCVVYAILIVFLSNERACHIFFFCSFFVTDFGARVRVRSSCGRNVRSSRYYVHGWSVSRVCQHPYAILIVFLSNERACRIFFFCSFFVTDFGARVRVRSSCDRNVRSSRFYAHGWSVSRVRQHPYAILSAFLSNERACQLFFFCSFFVTDSGARVCVRSSCGRNVRSSRFCVHGWSVSRVCQHQYAIQIVFLSDELGRRACIQIFFIYFLFCRTLVRVLGVVGS
jgi:hypothetical protein